MLESVLGIRLLLWTGGIVPTPRPELLPALQSVSVTDDAEGQDGFQLTFAASKDLLGRYDVLASGALALMNRVFIAAVIGVVPQMLIDGVITRHDVAPSSDPGRSTVTVTGTDVGTKLDLEEKNDPHKNQPDSVIITKLLLGYPELGLTPAVTPTTDVPIETDKVPHQYETDMGFIRRASERNGFIFSIEPVTMGVNTAYWGPVVRGGLPQPALTVGLGNAANVLSLSFSNDGLAPVGANGTFVEPITKAKIPIGPFPALRIPPLALFPAPTLRTKLLRDVSNAGPIDTALAAVAEATKAPEAIQGEGELDTARYGTVLRAGGLVGVRGAGFDYDGFYYVRSVTHTIERGSYHQRFSLSRDGTGPLTPVVRT